MKCVVCGKQIDEDVYINYSKDYGICNSRKGCSLKIPRKKLGKIKLSIEKNSKIENMIRGERDVSKD